MGFSADLTLQSIVDEGRERRLAHPEVLEFHGLAEPVEKALPGAEDTGAMMIVSSSTSPAARA